MKNKYLVGLVLAIVLIIVASIYYFNSQNVNAKFFSIHEINQMNGRDGNYKTEGYVVYISQPTEEMSGFIVLSEKNVNFNISKQLKNTEMLIITSNPTKFKMGKKSTVIIYASEINDGDRPGIKLIE